MILEICRRIDRSAYSPSVCSFFENGKLSEEFIKMNVPVYTVPKKRNLDWTLPFRLAKLFKKTNVDIVHTHNPSVWLYGGIAAKIAGIPLIHTEHTSSDYNAVRWGRIERFLSFFTQKITSVSESVAEFMIENEGISRKIVQVIHNGVKSEDYDIAVNRKNKRNDLGLAENDFVFINVARFYPNKDHSTLLRSFSLMLKKNPGCKLLLAGDGPLKESAIKEAAAYGLNGNVKFLGNRRDISEILKVSDVFVLSSIKEGLPIVILEAMASGLPVIATRVDGNTEVVNHDETGFIVPASDPNALSEMMIHVQLDKKKSVEMGQKGRQRVKKYFTFEKMVGEYRKLYDSVAVQG